MTQQAKLTVTFYLGDENYQDKLSKKYIVQHWQDEADLRQRVAEIAKELNYISGYGIAETAVKTEAFSFCVDYSATIKPVFQGAYVMFFNAQQMDIGYSIGSRRPVVLEIPRIHQFDGSGIFNLQTTPLSSKNKKKKRSHYFINYDKTDPIFCSFWQRLRQSEFVPDVQNSWENILIHRQLILRFVQLPKTQSTFYHIKQAREKRERQEKAEIKKAKQLAKVAQKTAVANNTDRYVYVIGSDINHYKIGISKTPQKRLQTLKTANPGQLCIVHTFIADPAEKAEAELHQRFAANRLNGEWFALTEEQIAQLKQITAYQQGVFACD